MTDLTPFTTKPIPVDRPWGGHLLAEMGKGSGRIGESWEIVDLPGEVAPHVDEPRTRIRSGPLQGHRLHELIERYGSEFMGSADPTPEGDFPLLIKLLDVHQHLSVQVHPHREYVEAHPGSRLKTESWYVVAAEPDSVLFLDVVERTDADTARDAIVSGNVRQILRELPAETGDFHHLPAGMVHAVGGGVLIAEVQTPSDTTFRIDDWRDIYDREERELHLQAAAETLLLAPPDQIDLPGSMVSGSRDLLGGDDYWIREHRHLGEAPHLLDLSELRILMVVDGSATINGDTHRKGTTIVVPAAAIRTLEVWMDGTLLEVGVSPVG